MSLKCKALHVQWVRRYVSVPSHWSFFLDYWVTSLFEASVKAVLSNPSRYSLFLLPPFYKSLFSAWSLLKGSFSTALDSLVWACHSVHRTVPMMSTKSCYQFLLEKSSKPAHCVSHFRPVFVDLYWLETWKQVSVCPIDRPVIDLNWKIAHGVLYTASRLSSFGYVIDTTCFCGFPNETLSHLFFDCSLVQSVIAWIQGLLLRAVPVGPSLITRHLLFGFSPDELLAIPPVFCYLLNVCKYQVWLARNDFRFRAIRPSAIVISSVKSRLKFILPLFFKRFKSAKRRRFFNRCVQCYRQGHGRFLTHNNVIVLIKKTENEHKNLSLFAACISFGLWSCSSLLICLSLQLT